MKNTFFCISILALLSGCATHYHSQNMFGNGFSETQTSPDSFIVNFHGNKHSKSSQMMQYAVRRAAELCLQSGYKYFKIVNTLDTSDYSGSSGSVSKAPAFSLRVKCSVEKTGDAEEVDAEFFLANNI